MVSMQENQLFKKLFINRFLADIEEETSSISCETTLNDVNDILGN